MRTKLLLLSALIACQCGLAAFAMENRQPAAASQQNGAQPLPATNRLSLYQQTAGAFTLINHHRAGAQSDFYGVLPADCVAQICYYVRDAIYYCSRCDNFATFDKNALDDHIKNEHQSCDLDESVHSCAPYASIVKHFVKIHNTIAHP